MSRRAKYRDFCQDEARFFLCCNCGRPVNPLLVGSRHRNHCPFCLWSLHVDLRPGDRMSLCHGRMEPVAVWVKQDGEWSLLHRCTNCGVIKSNRIAPDDEASVLCGLVERLIKQLEALHSQRS